MRARKPLMAFLVLAALAVGPHAEAASRYYAGRTAQGQSMLFSVFHGERGVFVEPREFVLFLACTESGEQIEAHLGFSGFLVPLRDRRFRLDLTDPFARFVWSGTVDRERASGDILFGFPAYTPEGGLQECTSGEVAWRARALVPTERRAPGESAPDDAYRVSIARDVGGQIRISITPPANG